MDLALDNKQAKSLDCNSCDYKTQRLRNCGGNYSKAIIKVNESVYRECPRSITFNNNSASFLISLYFDCRENKFLPFEGSLASQTAYLKDAFDFMDGIVNTYKERIQNEHEREMKKMSKKGNKSGNR